jgi:hypothetical protein
MRITDFRELPPGLPSAILFFGIVLIGALYIIIAKMAGFPAVAVTAVPILIMVCYALLLALARLCRLHDDQAGDNLYYMGFLFTLTSLAVSLYQFSATGLAEQIVQNFGIAIASTIVGIALRIFFNQMRRDPQEVEHTARLELADAARRVRRELDATILEFSYFRRTTQQSITEALGEVTAALNEAKGRVVTELDAFASAAKKPLEEAVGQSSAVLKEASGGLSQVIEATALRVQGAGNELSTALREARVQTTAELEAFAKASKTPLQDAAGQSGAIIQGLGERVAETISAATRQIQGAGSDLSRSAAAMAKSLDSVVAKLAAMKTPEQIIEIKLNPTISGLSRAVNNFAKNAELQAQAVDTNLAQTRALSAQIAALVEKMGTERVEPPPVSHANGTPHTDAPGRDLTV